MSTSSAPGSSSFTARDWSLLLGAGVMWGSSYLLIKIGLEGFAPETVAWLRLLFGVATLTMLPGARRGLQHRHDWWLVAVLGLVWMAVPFVLFPIAQQHIDSALAGMVNGAAPLFTALIAVLWFRNRPTTQVTAGLLVGFLGVVAIADPSVTGRATLLGILLVLAATVFFGVAFNLSGPLQGRNGALSVIWRAELVALAATTPTGVYGLTDSTPTWASLAAMVALGALCTGVAFYFFVTLVGRVGATRASVTVYLGPVVAIALGALLAGERVHPVALGGAALVLLGAYLTSRGTRARSRPLAQDGVRLLGTSRARTDRSSTAS